jgi:hypothetical protein
MFNIFSFLNLKKNIYEENGYMELTVKDIELIETKYKVINVFEINKDLIMNKIKDDPYFTPYRVKTIDDMLKFYDSSEDVKIYKYKTNYLCNETTKICFCNLLANTYSMNSKKYVSWIKLKDYNHIF